MRNRTVTYEDYSQGHPWYYFLGGAVPSLKAILRKVKDKSYKGYLADDIEKISQMQEPKRSEKLRAMRVKFLNELRNDLHRYRHLACELHRYRAEKSGSNPTEATCCEAVHTNISLKHNHLYNNFAHLVLIDDYLSEQPDLFDW